MSLSAVYAEHPRMQAISIDLVRQWDLSALARSRSRAAPSNGITMILLPWPSLPFSSSLGTSITARVSAVTWPFSIKTPGRLMFVPMVHGAIGVSDEIGARFIGNSLEFPARDSVARDEMVCAPVTPVVDEDVKPAAAEPDQRIFQATEIVLRQAGQVAVDAIALHVVGPRSTARLTDQDLAGPLHNLKPAVGPYDETHVRAVPGPGIRALERLRVPRRA